MSEEEIVGRIDDNQGGVLAAVLTPMDDGLAPDHPAFSAHCHRLLAAGCHGLSERFSKTAFRRTCCCRVRDHAPSQTPFA